MLEWIQDNDALLWWLGIGSIVTFFGSLLLVPVLVVRIPSDYLLSRDRRREQRREQHPVLRILGLVLKNVVGLLLVIAGLAMLALPGQGLLTMLMGLGLLNFPKKRQLLRRILGQEKLLGAINRMRARRNRAPLQIDRDGDSFEPLDSSV